MAHLCIAPQTPSRLDYAHPALSGLGVAELGGHRAERSPYGSPRAPAWILALRTAPSAPRNQPQPAARSVAARLCLGTVLALCGCAGGTPPPPLCLLVSIDTLRADALGCYGGPAAASPHLDALAAKGLRFESVYSQAPNTATSHASLFTGLLPFGHRVANVTSLEYGTPGLSPGFTTLAEHFAESGWDTAAFTDDGPLGSAWNLMQGFERLDARLEGTEAKVSAAVDFLEKRVSTQPLFLFVHTYEVHQPFAPKAQDLAPFDTGYQGPLRAVWADQSARLEAGEVLNDGRALLAGSAGFGPPEVAFLRALYQAELCSTDRALGRLFAAIENTCGPERALLAITSDHGEEFGEHGRFGHEQLFAETLRVPLLLALPGSALAGTQIDAPVAQFDLMPSLLELCGLPVPSSIQAQSFVSELNSGSLATRELFAETTEGLYAPTTHVDRLRARRHGSFAYLERQPSPDPSAPRRAEGQLPYGGSLFDLDTDPLELHPVYVPDQAPERTSPRHRGLAAAAQLRLAKMRQNSETLSRQLAASAALLPADPGTVEQLRKLGYLPGED